MAQESRLLHNLVSFLIIPAVLGFFFVPGHKAFAQEVVAEAEPAPVVETVEVETVEIVETEATTTETTEPAVEAIGDEVPAEEPVAPAPEPEDSEGVDVVVKAELEAGEVASAEEGEPVIAELPEVEQEIVVEIAEEVVSTDAPAEPALSSTDSLAISAEFGGVALVSVSESTFTTAPVAIGGLAISAEYSFSTSSNGGGCTSNCGSGGLAISAEFSFSTLGGGLAISDEQSFTTTSDDSGCTSNCGGGGGGGGGGRRPPRPEEPETPIVPCPLYLTEYIRLGRANNPLEVRKLQAFLNVFEGERLAITGVYSQADFDAVSRFQRKYGGDVLAPWAIDDSTGYVFITTRLAVNNIYCQRSTAHDLDLSRFYPEVYQLNLPGAAGVTEEVNEAEAEAVPELPEESADLSLGGRLQLAALAVLNIFKLSPVQALIALIGFAVLFTLLIIWRLNRYPDTEAPTDTGLEEDNFYPINTDDLEEIAEDEVIIEDDPAGELEAGSDDPTQPPLDSIK